MSKIVFATYIDNQKEIQYPIAFIYDAITKKGYDMIVFASDEENKLALDRYGAVNIDFKIKTHLDISTAQNKCIDSVFAVEKPDFVVWVQADTFITKEGFDIIDAHCTKGLEHLCFALKVQHLRLFHVCHSDYFGVTVIGRKSKERFIGDGAFTPNSGKNQIGSNSATIDIGYLTIEQCKMHLNMHQKTWSKQCKFLNLEEREFSKSFLKQNDVYRMIQEDDEFYHILVDMGLVQKFNAFKRIAPDKSELTNHGRMTAI